jgi:hypothetical protein
MLTGGAMSQGRASRFLDPVATTKLTVALARRPPAPITLGNRQHKAQAKAPGRHVYSV